MLGAIQIIIDGVWKLLSIPIPLAENISFTLWQYSFFIILVVIIIKQLFNKSSKGGD